MRKGIVECLIDGKEKNKENYCPDYTCDTCPKKEPPVQNKSSQTPQSFSKTYLGYLSNTINLKIGEDNELPPLFRQSNIYRKLINLSALNVGQKHQKTCRWLLSEAIEITLDYLTGQVKAKLSGLSNKTRFKLLVALHDLVDAYIQESIVNLDNKKGHEELAISRKAVNNLLALPILGSDERKVLLGIKSTLDELAKPAEYGPFWHLHLSTFKTWPDVKGDNAILDPWTVQRDRAAMEAEALQELSGEQDDIAPDEKAINDMFLEMENKVYKDPYKANDEYFVKHKNMLVKKTPYKFFKKSLQIVINLLLVNEGGQKKEASKHLTAELINDYLSSYREGAYKHLATFTYKTVENAGSSR